MYKEYFGLKENPFSIAPDPHYFYMSEGHREALAHLLYGIKSEGGFILLTGEVGTGKTTICRCLLQQIPEDTEIAFVLNPKLTVGELLASICDEFGIGYPAGTTSVKIFVDAIYNFLLETHEKGRRAILILEEAQNLSVDVLEQIRLLTNLETNQRKLLQIIMIGQPELKDILENEQLRQLSQRITARYHLGPLRAREVAGYVEHRLSVAGLIRGELFPPETIKALYQLSGGVPRLINLICDRALLGAYVQGKEHVDRKTLITAEREVTGTAVLKRHRKKMVQLISAGACVVVVMVIAGYLFMNQRGLSWSGLTSHAPSQRGPASQSEKGSDSKNPAPASTRDMAYEALFREWQAQYDARDKRSVCEQATAQGLQCIEGKGDLKLLKQYDKPAVLWLTDDKGLEYYIMLNSLKNDEALLVDRGKRLTKKVDELTSRWTGQYTILWKLDRSGESL